MLFKSLWQWTTLIININSRPEGTWTLTPFGTGFWVPHVYQFHHKPKKNQPSGAHHHIPSCLTHIRILNRCNNHSPTLRYIGVCELLAIHNLFTAKLPFAKPLLGCSGEGRSCTPVDLRWITYSSLTGTFERSIRNLHDQPFYPTALTCWQLTLPHKKFKLKLLTFQFALLAAS